MTDSRLQVLREIDDDFFDRLHFLCLSPSALSTGHRGVSIHTPKETLQQHLRMKLIQGSIMPCDMLEQVLVLIVLRVCKLRLPEQKHHMSSADEE